MFPTSIILVECVGMLTSPNDTENKVQDDGSFSLAGIWS